MTLTVNDVARMFDVPEKTVYGWIKQDEIPVYRVNDQYRFNRTELLEWATARRLQVSPEALQDAGQGTLPKLGDALAAGGVVYGLRGDDRPSLLRALVAALNLPDDVDREFLFQVLLARELLGSTGIGDGIAVPHVRNPIVLHVDSPTVTLCFLEHPIDFDAVDGKPVRIFFALISPSVKVHLHLLSRLGFVLRDPAFRAALQRQAPREDLLAALLAAEGKLAAGRSAGQAADAD